ncbi:S-adenosyl-L-methionine-dependent methyltransferase [Phycomyces nitens]|nr:S-adenosyl-L-methionine-dependent methyltransferase [Phycomyces nitens]
MMPIGSLRRIANQWPRLQKAYHSTFQAGDFCMLRDVRNNKKFFVGPLEVDSKRDIKGAIIAHADVINKPARTIIRAHKGNTGYMLHFPTLEEYVLNVPRACTPIYPKDASAIVQMLDIEPGHRILEAGTGNGALTLHLARAVGQDGKVDTFEIREPHARTAEKHVARFSRGRYLPTIAFHHGSVMDKVSQVGTNGCYDGLILDMPEPNLAWPVLLPYLRNDRFLVCYLPNMTQVLQLAGQLRGQHLVLEDCMEVEWKSWEVRSTQIRSRVAAAAAASSTSTPAEEVVQDGPGDASTDSVESVGSASSAADTGNTGDSLAWVCRPKNFDVRGHTAFLVKLRKCEPVA